MDIEAQTLNASKYKTSKTIYDEVNENEIPPDD